MPVPPPAVFLIAAAAVSDIWPSLYHHMPIHTVERVAVVALIVILFNGGMDIGWPSFRESAFPMVALGVLGTFITAGVVALFAHVALGFGWTLAGLVGAALAPTDPAVMFSVLGNHEIGGRSGTTLEGEAGLNDPAGIALMIGMIELATHADASAARRGARVRSRDERRPRLGAGRRLAARCSPAPDSPPERIASPAARARTGRCSLRRHLTPARVGLSRRLPRRADRGWWHAAA